LERSEENGTGSGQYLVADIDTTGVTTVLAIPAGIAWRAQGTPMGRECNSEPPEFSAGMLTTPPRLSVYCV